MESSELDKNKQYGDAGVVHGTLIRLATQCTSTSRVQAFGFSVNTDGTVKMKSCASNKHNQWVDGSFANACLLDPQQEACVQEVVDNWKRRGPGSTFQCYSAALDFSATN